MSALRLTELLGLVKFLEEIEECIRNGFLLDSTIKCLQFGGDLRVGIAATDACPTAHTGTPLIFRYVRHRPFRS